MLVTQNRDMRMNCAHVSQRVLHNDNKSGGLNTVFCYQV